MAITQQRLAEMQKMMLKMVETRNKLLEQEDDMIGKLMFEQLARAKSMKPVDIDMLGDTIPQP